MSSGQLLEESVDFSTQLPEYSMLPSFRGQLLEESVDFSTDHSALCWELDSMWTTPRGVCGLFNAEG